MAMCELVREVVVGSHGLIRLQSSWQRIQAAWSGHNYYGGTMHPCIEEASEFAWP